MNSDACPDRETLGKLLLGDLPAQQLEPLGQHLMNCDQCARAAETLSLSDELTAAIRTRRVFEDEEPILADVIARGKQLGSGHGTAEPEATVVVSQSSEHEALDDRSFDQVTEGDTISEEDYDFLDPPQEHDEIGRLGGYRVLEVMGAGGMGVVFRAEDPRLERIVALKAMKPVVAASRSAKERFLKEAKATASIDHDNIVQIYQVGEDRNVPFIAMRFLRGESLKSRLEREKQLDQRETVHIGRAVAAGLAAAHQRNLIHRDIKPDNIWLEAGSGRVKILDFGLVRNVSEDAGITQSGMVLGTPRYMAPEQAQGQELDHRCDLFSLGSVLYRLITGKAPFGSGNLTATLMAVAHTDAAPIEELVPEIHPGLSKLINQLLSKDRARRPQSAGEVVTALSAIERDLESGYQPQMTDEKTVIAHPVSQTLVEAEPAPVIKVADGGDRRPPRRKPGLWMWGSFAAIVLLGVITFATAKGTVTIDIPKEMKDDVVVNIHGEHDVVEVLHKQNDWSVKLASGEYTLQVTGGNEEFHLAENTIEVTRFGRRVVHMDYKPKPKNELRFPRLDGYALQFDGYDDRISLPFGYDGKHPLTVEAWVRSIPEQRQEFVISNANQSGIAIGRGGDSSEKWQGDGWKGFAAFRGVPRDEQFLWSDFATENRWSHLALVVDGRSVRFSVNGRLVSVSHPSEKTFQPSTENWIVGGGSKHQRFQGLIDEIRISNVARYSDDFTPVQRFESDEHTLALYHFDEGRGAVLKDSSGHGRDGALAGPTWVNADGSPITSPPSPGKSWQELLPADAPAPAIAPFTAEEAKQHQEAWADYLDVPVERVLELADGVQMSFMLIPPGEFEMGEDSGHSVVQIDQPFYLGTTEVTQGQFKAMMESHPKAWDQSGDDKAGPDFPANWVSWGAVHKFCGNLTSHERQAGRLPRSVQFRLPTEAEWEYACRAGSQDLFAFGSDSHQLGDYAWFEGNTRAPGEGYPHAVRQKQPNSWGLFDLHGNLKEWCDSDYYPEAQSSLKVVRGGGYSHPAEHCRSGKRESLGTLWFTIDTGFRVVLPVDEFNPPPATPGNSALSFDGKDDYVEIPNPDEWRNGPLTLEATVRTELTGEQLPAVLQLAGLKVRMFRPGFQWMFIAYGPAEKTLLIGEPRMPLQQKLKELEQPLRIAAVYDRSSISLFINGQRRASTRVPEDFTIRPVADKGYIGTSSISAPDAFFTGQIDEVRISNTARYMEDYAPAGRLDADEHTLALYHFDEGKGSVLIDSSGNEHHGEIFGAQWVTIVSDPAAPKRPADE